MVKKTSGLGFKKTSGSLSLVSTMAAAKYHMQGVPGGFHSTSGPGSPSGRAFGDIFRPEEPPPNSGKKCKCGMPWSKECLMTAAVKKHVHWDTDPTKPLKPAVPGKNNMPPDFPYCQMTHCPLDPTKDWEVPAWEWKLQSSDIFCTHSACSCRYNHAFHRDLFELTGSPCYGGQLEPQETRNPYQPDWSRDTRIYEVGGKRKRV